MSKRIIMCAESERDKSEVLERLLWAWFAAPELRLGQLISNAAGDDLFYIEDYELLDRVERKKQ